MSLLQDALDRIDVVLAVCDGPTPMEKTVRTYLARARGDLVALGQLASLQAEVETRAECVRRHLSIVK